MEAGSVDEPLHLVGWFLPKKVECDYLDYLGLMVSCKTSDLGSDDGNLGKIEGER